VISVVTFEDFLGQETQTIAFGRSVNRQLDRGAEKLCASRRKDVNDVGCLGDTRGELHSISHRLN
jgi:hypothetical protein